MSRESLEKIVDQFELRRFKRFLSDKNRTFKESSESLDHFGDRVFVDGQKLGTIQFDDGNLIVCAFKVTSGLIERSGKKAQYELGKKILKSTLTDSGIFIFFSDSGAFRFSLIYANYLGKKRDWSSFRRCTYFVSRELTNKTFLKRIGDCDFASLSRIQEAFSVEKVTKEFYENIANWYFWAVQKCEFPKDAEVEDNGRNIAVIRLITRIIFIWFMRERGLVPKSLFKAFEMSSVLKDISPDSSSYYLAILQNLFFATLSTKQTDRKFRSEIRGIKGINPDFGNHNVYRYHELFKAPEKIEQYFGEIPFLNGGLFECLDDKSQDKYIDGFTAVKKNQPKVPNFLFFSPGDTADLNAVYGTKGKKYNVRGLFDILSSFNFTIDENSPDDQDIALDPELLGRVFENLLASYNPETASTARKATGSYYTPREIVDYMVTESLKAYFRTHLSDIQNLDQKLEKLFQSTNQENPFDPSQSMGIVDLIEKVKIVDPAVGSGAFPMGVLNRLVFVLNKLDPGNALWKRAQLTAADSIPDPRVRKEAKKRIEEFFQTKNADYGRKLFLIQKCIYGVDIQEIAVEIAKLRFFISLLVDEKIDKSQENLGIEPLPNLDFKIMQGNSLVSEYRGINFDNGSSGQTSLGMGLEDQNFVREFEQKKIEFQNEPDRDRKAQLREEIDDILIKLFEIKFKKQKADYYRRFKAIEEKYSAVPNKKEREEIIAVEKAALSKSEGFDLSKFESEIKEFSSKNRTKPFFAWKLYFAEVFNGDQGGFDVVIANPPYVSVKSIGQLEKSRFAAIYEAGEGRLNLFALFLERGIKLLKDFGLLTYIVPEGIYSHVEYRHIRKFVLDNSTIHFVNLFSDRVFDAAVDTTIISLMGTKSGHSSFPVYRDLHKKVLELDQQALYNYPTTLFPVNLTRESKPIIDNLLERGNSRIADLLEIQQGIIYSGQEKEKVFANSLVNSSYKPVLDGRDILKWVVNWSAKKENKYIKYTSKLHRAREERIFLAEEKILLPRKSTKLQCAYDSEKFYALNTAYICLLKDKRFELKYILACLNSRLINYFYTQLYFGWQVTIPALYSIPIKCAASHIQHEICGIVDKILATTEQGDLSNKSDLKAQVKQYENEIDRLIFRLYDLSSKEIEIVENKETK